MLNLINSGTGSILVIIVLIILSIVIPLLTIIKGIRSKKWNIAGIVFSVLFIVITIFMICISFQMGNNIPSEVPTPTPFP